MKDVNPIITTGNKTGLDFQLGVEGNAAKLKEALKKDKNALKTLPTKTPKPIRNCPEIDDVWNSFPNLRTHRNPASGVYKEAVKWIHILDRGELRLNVNVSELVERLGENGIKPSQIHPLLDRKFSMDERVEVYRRLNAMKHPPIGLPNAIYTPPTQFNQYRPMSWFLYAFIKGDPSVPEKDEVIDICVKAVKEVCMTNHRESTIASVVRKHRIYYDAEIEPILTSGGMSVMRGGVFYGYIKAYCKFLTDNYSYTPNICITLDWFRLFSKFHQRWLMQFFEWHGSTKRGYSKEDYQRMLRRHWKKYVLHVPDHPTVLEE